ncbi:MAG TPA: TIGR03745 family integrating conjugative element membrane protein [Rubrivivax sp.]|nr:TIGR03745 family integrating conjugative element membrane protein [Rubrivivax sp.]
MNASTSHRTAARTVHIPRAAATLLALSVAAMPLSSWAALPTLEDPSRGTGSGIMQTLQNYSYDIVLLIALLVVASMFVGVCYHAYTRYAEIHTGRATWGQFGLTVAVGAILLVVGIWLLTKATGVL